MKLNELRDNPGAVQDRMRVGRGVGSGKGKTAGRGQKGQKARTGVSINGFEGGQMPLYRRLPKRGFVNTLAKEFAVVSVARIQKAFDAGKLDAKKTVDAAALVEAGVIRRVKKDGVRLIGNEGLKTNADFIVAGVTAGATKAIEAAKGSVKVEEFKMPSSKPSKEKAKAEKKEASKEVKKAPAKKAPTKKTTAKKESK